MYAVPPGRWLIGQTAIEAGSPLGDHLDLDIDVHGEFDDFERASRWIRQRHHFTVHLVDLLVVPHIFDVHRRFHHIVQRRVAGVDDGQASAEFREWLDIQSRFHDYSYRNTLLIKRQCPEATRVAGYRTWQEEFDRHVQKNESAIWIWAPIITKRCPECENSPSYHENSDCDYDETPPEEWSEGLVGFKPAPVFDVSQTEGEPLPDLDTEATGDVSNLVDRLTDAADELGVTVRIVPSDEWTHGEAKGICEQLSLVNIQPRVEVRDRENDADLPRT